MLILTSQTSFDSWSIRISKRLEEYIVLIEHCKNSSYILPVDALKQEMDDLKALYGIIGIARATPKENMHVSIRNNEVDLVMGVNLIAWKDHIYDV